MLAEVYGSQPVWTPLRLFRAALIALVGGVVAGTHAAARIPQACMKCPDLYQHVLYSGKIVDDRKGR